MAEAHRRGGLVAIAQRCVHGWASRGPRRRCSTAWPSARYRPGDRRRRHLGLRHAGRRAGARHRPHRALGGGGRRRCPASRSTDSAGRASSRCTCRRRRGGRALRRRGRRRWSRCRARRWAHRWPTVAIRIRRLSAIATARPRTRASAPRWSPRSGALTAPRSTSSRSDRMKAAAAQIPAPSMTRSSPSRTRTATGAPGRGHPPRQHHRGNG